MWKFLVKNQSIEIVEREILADHQIQYVQFKFTFDGDWKRFHKVVQFSQCDEVYSVVLGTEGTTLYLPAELHAGAVKKAVFGYDTESDTTVRATTVPVTLNIRESGFEGDEPPIPPTPDLYTQLLKRIEDAEHGLDGKSAYEIAVEHGYVGTEEEWLASLHGKDGITPDMSEYPKTSEVTTIIEREIAPVAEESHTHDNKATLDSITPELFSDLSGLQQFEDSTTYELQTLNEAVENLRPSTHTHNNKAVLDRITEAMIDAIAEYPPFEDWTREQIHTLFEMVNNFSNTAHTHENKVTLDALTPELFSDLAGLQQFEDSTQYDIQTINEALLTLNAQRHTHDNKAVLDTITEQYMRDQAAFQASTAGALHGLSTGLSEVSAQAHSHANKAVLDGITQEMLDDMASIATVIGQAHWHHNLTTLNSITESHVSRWNEAYTAAMNLNERVGVNEGVFERFKTEILYDMQGAKTSITDIYTRLEAVENALSGVEEALSNIVEVTA
ncbi:hypothetical protein [Ruminococcus sp. XPD3002]|uniref:hypothetical protein n=1 Tax=Ruminococcus sp. XPD3002 TaxID=1452269 RepID=UPI0009224B96|nr:hypothetical protein SAMN04487832_10815 [Ruminococcus flavefaciens]